MVQGFERVARRQLLAVEGAHEKGVLVARVAPHAGPGGEVQAVTSSADRTLALWRLAGWGGPGASCMRAGALPAPAAPCICLEFHPTVPGMLALGAMDGDLWVLRGVGVEGAEPEVAWRVRAHQKYVVRLRWTPRGLASASYDKTVALFRAEEGSAPQEARLREAKRWAFGAAVEALEVTGGGELVVAARDDNYLSYVDLAAPGLPLRRVNMNANLDDHVSFTALDLRCSPSGAHLLVQTDKDRLIIMRTGTSLHVRNLYGASNDAFSQPRAVWHPSGKYIFGTSQDRRLYVWNVVSGEVLYTMAGHAQFVRDLCFHPTEELLLTCSYDRSIRWWAREEEEEPQA